MRAILTGVLLLLASTCWAGPSMLFMASLQIGTPPDQVTGLSASNSPAQITVSWTAVSGASYYNVYYSTTNSSSGATKISGATSVTSYSINGPLTSGTTYYVWVSAQNSGGEGPLSTSTSAVATTATIALIPSANTGFESGVLSPWVDASLNGGGSASSSASVISTAEMTGSKALQLASTGGNDYDGNSESGGPTDGTALAKYTFPIAAIDSTHKIIKFDVRPKVLHAGGNYGEYAYVLLIALKVFNGATVINDLSWPVSAISIFAYPAMNPYSGSFLVPSPVVDTTYTVQADILARAQSSLLSGHTWAEATSVEVSIVALANGADSDGAGTITNNSLCTVLVDNFR